MNFLAYLCNAINEQTNIHMEKQRFTFRNGNVILHFSVGLSLNRKITLSNNPIAQHYSFSKEQYEFCKVGGFKIMDFVKMDGENCLDCPYSFTNGYKGGRCYTHQFPQLRGFTSVLKGIANKYPTFDSIPEITDTIPAELLKAVQGKYVRFGTYGEVVFIPYSWVEAICGACSAYTGYTHQWDKPKYMEYGKRFMASTHSIEETKEALERGFRSFMVYKKNERHDNKNLVTCPADREKTSCQKCALCSGTEGKGMKSIKILYH